MKKFKLTKKDAISLENTTSLMSNPVLKNASFEVTNSCLTGRFAKVDFAKIIKTLPDTN
ncbi:hypothetical protein [Flavobacterium daejeonense]|uniref:hypothetical protein n=1 Tax=Flavobacterium daejeonense TaxID=350893 RepID=UPI000AD1717E|nr:hypothetical protein [Flavobacterium daejeonense]